jgi:chromosome segregation ATPase
MSERETAAGELAHEPAGIPERWGSAFRAGRDDAAYQSGRAREFVRQLADLADLYAKRARALDHKAAELWRGNRWIDEQRAHWQQAAEAAEKVVAEQAAWIQELERAKEWLEQQRGGWQRTAEARERELAGEVRRLAEVNQRVEELGVSISELKQDVARREKQRQETEASLAQLREQLRVLEHDLLAQQRRGEELSVRLQGARESCASWKRQFWFRALRRVRLLRDLNFET